MSKIIEKIGGSQVIREIIDDFYNQVFAHPILSQFFIDVSHDHQVRQFTDFMVGLLGGEKKFSGRLPDSAHTHLMISKEHFKIRQEILEKTLKKHLNSNDLIEIWLNIDKSFEKVIVKESIKDCKKRFFTDNIISIKNNR